MTVMRWSLRTSWSARSIVNVRFPWTRRHRGTPHFGVGDAPMKVDRIRRPNPPPRHPRNSPAPSTPGEKGAIVVDEPLLGEPQRGSPQRHESPDAVTPEIG